MNRIGIDGDTGVLEEGREITSGSREIAPKRQYNDHYAPIKNDGCGPRQGC